MLNVLYNTLRLTCHIVFSIFSQNSTDSKTFISLILCSVGFHNQKFISVLGEKKKQNLKEGMWYKRQKTLKSLLITSKIL